MKSGYYAGIDIGTNAARLVIKDTFINQKHEVDSVEVQKIRIPLRLGVDVFKNGEISQKKIEQLGLTILAFKSIMEIYNVIDFSCFATSAMREAKNGNEAIEYVKEKTGITIKIISGEDEAKTVSKIAKNIKLDNNPYVFVDVGGGSTEVTLVENKKAIESNSYRLGTLRILASQDKQETWDNFKSKLKEYKSKYGATNIVGTGGNINRYWKMSKKKEKNNIPVLDVSTFIDIYQDIRLMTSAERMEKFDIKPDRADVIIPAGEIFATASKILDSKTIIVPMIGLSDGIVDSLIQEHIDVI